jgi:16S rRNA (adenine1518-N6/adenine1519-N6)-dimethyltransferase
LGQVFLTDRRVIRRIMSALAVEPGDAVLEIGAGPGTMTELLAERAAKLWAVEVDTKLAAGLREKFAGSANVEVIEADILKVPIDALCAASGRERIRVFGNLPYYITSPILLRLFEYHARIADIFVMVHQEVA